MISYWLPRYTIDKYPFSYMFVLQHRIGIEHDRVCYFADTCVKFTVCVCG